MTPFKLAGDIAKNQLGCVIKDLKPCKLTSYDGIIAGSIIFNTPIFAENFVCPSCKSKSCYQVLHYAKKYLACSESACIANNSGKTIYTPPKITLEQCGVPSDLQNAKYTDCIQDADIQQKTKDFIAKRNGFCLLAGKPGRGKSYLAACMVRLALENETNCLFITHADLYQKWLEKTSSGQSVVFLLDQMQQKKLLVIDDLGSVKITEGFGDFIFMLIDKRKNTPGIATIITTNFDSTQLNEKLGSPIMSRLKTGLILKLTKEDQRVSF